MKILMAGGFTSLWRSVVLPWFRETVGTAWKTDQPVVVLVPSRNYAFFLKHKLLEENVHFAGIHFWTPVECRAFLLRRAHGDVSVLERHHLSLLLAAEAEQMSADAVARAVSREPGSLLRVLEQLSEAGWSWAALENEALAPLVGRIFARLENKGLITSAQVDTWLSAQHEPAETLIESLLIVGFDGSYWNEWQLLNTAIRTSGGAGVCLLRPRYKSEAVDQLWISSLEDVYGEAIAVDGLESSGTSPFAALAAHMETDGQSQSEAEQEQKIVFHAGQNVQEEARAVAAQAIAFLADDTCTSLGLVFPGYSALSREVGALLKAEGIVFNDTLGHNMPALPEEQAWTMWLEFQKMPNLETFLELSRLRGNTPDERGELRNTQRMLERAFNEVLVDDLDVLVGLMQASERKRDQSVAASIGRLVRLPDTGSFAQFLAATSKALDALDWQTRMQNIQRQTGAIQDLLPKRISRRVYLAWLEEITRYQAWEKDPELVHPFARVHLITYTRADWQDWSHLVLAGLNEGDWPPASANLPFLDEKLVSDLNKRAVEQGSQGEGHAVVKAGRSLITGPAENRAIVQRQFLNLLESVNAGLATTVAVTNEADAVHRRIPGDLLSHMFYTQTGQPLSDKLIDQLRENSAAWVNAAKLFDESGKETERPGAGKAPSPEETEQAYIQRRDISQPFGKYSFTLSKKPPQPLTIACREWESAVTTPALVWMKHVLGVEDTTVDLNESRWPLATGIWVHRWLSKACADATGQVVDMPSPVAFRERLQSAARKTQKIAGAAFENVSGVPPDWWEAGWREACRIAAEMAEALLVVEDWPYAVSEWTLPRDMVLKTSTGGELRLKGRMDLVLARQKEPIDKGNHYWVVDYKTGTSVKPSTSKNFAKNLLKGRGIQIALYALALADAGVNEVALTLLAPDSAMKPQLTAADYQSCEFFWRALCRMQDTGIFGMRGEIRPEFGASVSYPLAMLKVSPEILEQKWVLTHPLFSQSEEAGTENA